MKKSLLLGALFASLALSVQAQTRFSIHEEFTGENCGPCAGTNPGFWRLCDSGTNPSKMIHIAHMVPIPSSGWFYMQTQTISDARAAYYTVPFAPYGRLNGQIPYASASTSSPGHPVYFTQAEIDSAARIPSPFNITVSNSWNANYDSVVTTVTITCVTNWTGTGVYLRAALVQNVLFSTPPGSNGEYDYRNIVRAMYPNATGTSLAGTWTTGMAQTLTITGAVPNFVQKEKSPFMVVWIQNDADKKIAQAAKATPLPLVPNDAAIDSIVPIGMICSNPGNYITGHTIRLHNVGSNAITSATIYYKKDGAASFNTYNWTGSLALGASAMVTLPNDTFVVGANPAYHSFYDSVANVNGTTDKNLPNNTNGDYFFIETNTALSMPYTTSFESADLGKFYYTDVNNNNKTWGAFQATSGSLVPVSLKCLLYPKLPPLLLLRLIFTWLIKDMTTLLMIN
ncbi:MAG: hypothetical protein EBX41_02230 [Chitinophagia bacterium]|nr:hypothetical protein [Chitinophagia bacterium]